MNATFVFAAAASLVAAVPAVAEPRAPEKPADSMIAAASTPAAKPVQYCFEDTITGSRVPVKKCRTRAEWNRMGVEIPSQYLR